MNKMYKEDPKLTCLLHKMNIKEYWIWTKLTKKIVEQCKKMEISDQCIYEIAKRHSDAFKYNGIGKKYYKQDGKEYFYYVPVGNNFKDKEGYSKEFGYYAARPFIGWDEIRHEEVLIKTKSEDEALKYFLFLDIIYASKLTSKIKEEELRKEWKYDVEFTREKFESEFIINAYNHVLSEDGINVFIEKDTIELNKIAGKKYWMFDKDIMEFVPLKQTNIKNDSA